MTFPVPTTEFAELINAAWMNTYVRDTVSNINQHSFVRKTLDEAVTNSAAVQDDNELSLPVGTTQKWAVEGCLIVSCDSASPDFRMTFTVPAGATVKWSMFPEISGGGSFVPSVSRAATVEGTTRNFGTTDLVYVVAGITTAGTAGNLLLRWAQGGAVPAQSTTIRARSWLKGRLI